MSYDLLGEFSLSSNFSSYYGSSTTTNQTSISSNTAVNSKNKKKITTQLKILENKRKAKCLRKAGGEVWADQTLEEWADEDYRIFCGDLGNEVTDEVLANAFRKYTSFLKAKVIRDKRTGKTKGFGFVSLGNSEDYARGMKEMNGKYVGNRPIKLKRSKWSDRSFFGGKSTLAAKFKKSKK